MISQNTSIDNSPSNVGDINDSQSIPEDDPLNYSMCNYGMQKQEEPDMNIKKRNRISFVCQTCRKSKTKCDRQKPECGRCTKLSLKCVYDVSKQVPPRIPSKDATIARLQKDVYYWKNKAMALLDEQKYIDSNTDDDSNKRKSLDDNLSSSSDDYSPKRKQSSPIHNDIEINLYKSHSTMIFSKVMKQDVKPLSENFLIIQDKFISSLIASIFIHPSSNSMIPALTANANISRAQPTGKSNVLKLKEVLMSQYHDPAQREKINEFTDRILQNANASRNLKIGMILSMLYNTVGHEYLEDHCPKEGEYSDLLKNFIQEFEEILPPMHIINSYKDHFYAYIHPNLPFLDIEMFEESLSQTILVDPNDPNKVKLQLGNNHLRYKLENLSILLVVLKLSYISYKLIDKKPNCNPSRYLNHEIIESYPLTNDVILLAQRCLASENWCACTNENIITCLLYIWSFFAFSPEEGDFFLEHPTDVISSLIMMLSTSIGLHRDPYDFPQLTDQTLSDKRILNQRRLLWISVVGVCSFESTLKGRHPILSMDLISSFMDIRHPNFLKVYMDRVKKDIDYDYLKRSTNNNSKEIEKRIEKTLAIHEYTLVRAQFSVLLADLDNLTLSYNNTFSLEYIKLSREKIENFIEENLPLINFKEIDVESESYNIFNKYGMADKFENKERNKTELDEAYHAKLTFYSFKNSNALQTRIMNKLMMLRTTEAIFLHFESKMAEDRDKYFPYYCEYFTKTCVDSLSLIKMFNELFTDKWDNFLLAPSHYNVRKVLQLALPTTIFSLLGTILRTNLTCNKLFSKCQEISKNADKYSPEYFKELNEKLELISILQKDLETALEYIYVFSSEHLRFRYFSVFKMFALFDVIVQRMRKGELWLGICKLTNVGKFHSKIVKTLRMTLGVEVDKKEELLKDLERRNHVGEINLEDLRALCQTVREIHRTIPKPMMRNSADKGLSSDINSNKDTVADYAGNSGVPPSNNEPNVMYSNDNIAQDSTKNPTFTNISSLDNLQKLSSAASISSSINIDNNMFMARHANNSTPSDQSFSSNGITSINGKVPSSDVAGQETNNVDIDNDAGIRNSEGGNGNKNSEGNVNMTNHFMEGNTTRVNATYDMPGFLGGLDLFDYDFLFGSDIS